MNELFGLSMTTIAIVLGAILGIALLMVGATGIANRTMFKFGLRNIPRRGLQSVLVITGLALATLITTAAFVTGDTVDNSLTKDSEKVFGASDIDITWTGEREWIRDSGVAVEGGQVLMDGTVVGQLESAFGGDGDFRGFLPWLTFPPRVTTLRPGDAGPPTQPRGAAATRLDAVGGLTLTNGDVARVSDLGPNQVYLSQRAANQLNARLGDQLTIHFGNSAQTVSIAGIVRDELASGVLGMSYSTVPGGLVLPIERLRELAGTSDGAISSLTVALVRTDENALTIGKTVAARINAYLQGPAGAELRAAGGLEPGREIEAFAARQRAIEEAQLTGNIMTTLFLVLGLFSMAAGVMLIFMIFVMLAAERRSEMGIARAVGAQRRHLVQSFLAEGMAYSLLAGVIGVAGGILAAWALLDVLLKQTGGDYFQLVEMKITARSIFVGYALGVVVPFITVVFASMKASHVNIVAAIRQLSDESRRESRREMSWRWTIAGVLTLPILPLGLWLLLRKGLGLPWAWILGPAGIVLGALFMLLGKSSETLFPFTLGISLIPLSIASLLRYYRVPARPLWTTVGLVLGLYWLMPDSLHSRLFGDFNSDLEMFVLSGIMIVISFTLVIVFNARLLTGMFSSEQGGRAYRGAALLALAGAVVAGFGFILRDTGQGLGQLLFLVAGLILPAAALSAAAARFPQLAPALKMAVAYPLANRFRTGMTIAMFSLIVFSLTVFSVILANFQAAFLGSDARGNLDLVVTANQSSGVGDIGEALEVAGNPAAQEIAALGRVTISRGPQWVMQTDVPSNAGYYPVLGADDQFLGPLGASLDAIATGYADEAAVWAAVRANPNLAIADGTVVGVNWNDTYPWTTSSPELKGDTFRPIPVTISDAATGGQAQVTIIGVLKMQLPSSTMAGIYLNERAYRDLLGEPEYLRTYVRLEPGADSEQAARLIDADLAVRGVDAQSIQKILDDLSATNMAFNRMFQAFMALGLLVGIAGLGVIAFRSVVERRQQIGMLRAIGYQRGVVTMTFLFESSFIAVMGILSGVVGGAILGRNLLTSPDFTEGADINFAMPWAELLVVIIASFAFSLMMTWWPSRGASRVPVAEALRYE
ncbi:MAG TPA: FtsX-like permease family protein [Tepidiformaceae bacterium]|nr:FtsX-like permease family protein [Tepidiformaceae bacterium]